MATLDAEFEGYMLSNDCSYVLNFSPGPAQFPRQIEKLLFHLSPLSSDFDCFPPLG